MKTFKFSLVLRTHENTNVFISLDDNIYGIHSKRINILYISSFSNITTVSWPLPTENWSWNYSPLKEHIFSVVGSWTWSEAMCEKGPSLSMQTGLHSMP